MMSARKKAVVSIRELNYEREHARDMAALFSDRASQSEIQDIRDQLSTSYQEMQDRHQNFETIIASFNANIADLETQTNLTIADQQQSLFAQVDAIADDINSRTSRMLTDELERFEEQVDLLDRNHESDIEGLKTNLAEIQSNKNNIKYMVLDLLDNSHALMVFIQQHYDLDRFSPQTFNELQLQIQQAELILSQNILEAAYLHSFQVYHNISNYRIWLEKQHSKWSILYNRTLLAAKHLYKLGKENRLIYPVDLDWNLLNDSHKKNLNFWSDGLYQKWFLEIKTLLHSLLGDNPRLSIEDLDYMLNQQLPELQNELEQMIYQARQSMLSSQIRINIASVIMHSLSEQGYIREKASYIDNDERLGFEAVVGNRDQNKVHISIDPDKDFHKSVVRLDTHSQNQYTEHEMNRRNYEILHSLNRYGLNVGEIITSNNPTNRINETTGSYQTQKPKTYKKSNPSIR